MKLNKNQEKFLAFLQMTLFLIAISLSLLIGTKMYFYNDKENTYIGKGCDRIP